MRSNGQTRRLQAPKVEIPVEPPERVRATARRRLGVVSGCLAAFLVVIGARGVALCLSPEERTLVAGSSQRWDQVTLSARRGDILDRSGRPLATSVSTPNIVVDPARVAPEEAPALAARVARLLDLPEAQVLERMQREGRYARLAMRVHPSVADAVLGLGHPALWAERDRRRYYPEATLASQLLGFVDASGTGREGLEAALDEELRGESVLVQRRRDRHGLDVDDPVETRIHEGRDVRLTIDRTLQHVAEQALAGVVERSAPKSASAVVVDVRTGDILALANLPAFNPNQVGDDAVPRKNHVLQDAIEPGSVMKPFTMAAALEEGIVHEDTVMDCEGGSWFVGRTRIHDDHPHGAITATEVIKYSSNICSAKLALRMGPDTFLRYMKDFGFGERTGVPLPGERRGKLREAGAILPIELATTSYGQGVTATALQIAMATATIANGGVRMNARIIVEIDDATGVPERVDRPAPVKRVVSEETARTVARMMRTVTEAGGTASHAVVPGYPVAGKTGTAWKVVDGKYTSARIGSFAGFLPADDPVLAIVVVVDEPSIGSRYGGIVAAPAFVEIGKRAMKYLGIPPRSEGPAPDEAVAAAAPPAPVEPAVALAAPAVAQVPSMPDLTGVSLRSALASLQGAGLRLALHGSGRVASQEPRPGAALAVGQTVTLVLR